MKKQSNTETAINNHINIEWNASYSFLAISSWFETTPFKGFAKNFLRRSERESRHAMQFYDFQKNRLGVIEILDVPQPKAMSFKSPMHACEVALSIKHDVIKASHKLFAQAVKEEDYELQEFLHGIFQEQIQEEKHMQDHIDKLGIAKDNADALIHLDYKEEVLYASAGKS
jgi:ferritin